MKGAPDQPVEDDLLLAGSAPPSRGHSCLDRLAGDVSLGDGAANDALAAAFFDFNEASFPVRVEASPGPRLERANLIDSEVSRFEAILDRDDRLFDFAAS
jgi:hypothetical protein